MDLAFQKDAFAKQDRPADLATVPDANAMGLRDAASRDPAQFGALDEIPHMLWMADGGGRVIRANAEVIRFTGAGMAVAAATEFCAGLVHPDEHDRVQQAWMTARSTGAAFECTFRIRHHSGAHRWVRCRARPSQNAHGRVQSWYGTFTEVHEAIVTQQNLQEVRNIRDNIVEASSDCIKVLSLDGTLRQINDYGVSALELESREWAIGQNWTNLWPKASRRKAAEALRQAAAGQPARFAGHGFTMKGTECWWDNVITPIRGANGAPHSLLCISRNVTHQKRAAEGLRETSDRDALTKLPNRRAFERRLNRVIASARDSKASVALLLIDLDHFKSLNDTLGHLAGDHLLRIFARRLRMLASSTTFVARLGGDEFAIVLSGNCQEAAALQMAATVIRRNEEPISYGGRCVNGGISIGCAMYPRDAGSARELFKLADTALYDMKAGGRGGVQVFTPAMMDTAQAKAKQLDLARHAVQAELIVPHYQPKVCLTDGRIVGFEALLRIGSRAGLQSPDSIAAAFNEYDLATRISTHMQEAVFADMIRLIGQGLDPGIVSINAAPVEFLRDDFAERLLARLDRFGLPPQSLELEITEHGLLDRGARYVLRALSALREAGVRIALDDFGTGSASLTHLREFPVHSLKIDKSFITRMMSNAETLAIVQAIVALGAALKIDIIAEGIEAVEQVHLLADAGCQIGQGYFFGKAMPLDEIASRLQSDSWAFRRRTGLAD